MSSTSNGSGPGQARERLLDLLATKATERLTAQEEAELAGLLKAHPDVDADEFELAAAAAELAMLDERAARLPLPTDLRGRLLAVVERGGEPPAPIRLRDASPSSRLPLGWLTAAAAVAIAAVGWWQAMAPAPAPRAMAMTARYADFQKEASDAVHWPWEGKESRFAGVKGEVVWSDRLQRGYMLLSGLPANNPAQEQYQLWIVDPNRDKHPVDGGVFNMAAAPADGERMPTGEVIVPIDCKLKVQSPAAFALTVEKPGGVVVSAGPLVVVAARKG